MAAFHFPRWTNHLLYLIPAGAAGGAVYAMVFIFFGLSPKTLAVGYAPEQPLPFRHSLHAGELGLDCRYCHNTVEDAAHAAVPPAATCANCHDPEKGLHADNPNLKPVHDAIASGDPIRWVRVHDLGDFAYFNHSAHVTRGIGCSSCHGRIDQMDVVTQRESLSMGWCLECHRNPQPHLRPLSEITNMAWELPEGGVPSEDLFYDHNEIDAQETCSTCHR